MKVFFFTFGWIEYTSCWLSTNSTSFVLSVTSQCTRLTEVVLAPVCVCDIGTMNLGAGGGGGGGGDFSSN